MEEFKQVEGHNSLYKNEETGLIVTKGSSSLRDQYRLAKQQALNNIETRDDLKDLQKRR